MKTKIKDDKEPNPNVPMARTYDTGHGELAILQRFLESNGPVFSVWVRNKYPTVNPKETLTRILTGIEDELRNWAKH